MEIKTVLEGKTLLSGQIVFDATVSLTESGRFSTMEERDGWVAEKTGELNRLISAKPEEGRTVKAPKKVKK